MLYIALAAAVGLIGLDQLTKILIDSNMSLHDSIPLIQFGDVQVFNITYERNTGAAFSMLEDKQLMLIIITAAVLIGMLLLLFTKRVKNPRYIWCISLIFAGGAGNLIDRLLRGFVVDFFDFRLIHFAVFNVADICAVVGAVGLVIFIFIDEIKEHRRKKATTHMDGEPDGEV